MVHWVYITECVELYIYVGETTRLFRRFNEHDCGRGSVNTSRHKPLYLVGLYKVADNISFMKYRKHIQNNEYDFFTIKNWGTDDSGNLEVENHLTERLFYERKDNHEYGTGEEWYRVRGGKYTRKNLDNSLESAKELCDIPNRIKGTLKMTTPIDKMKESEIVDRPLCHCSYPCEVKLSKDKNCIYFVCALKNAWDTESMGCLKTDEFCDFYKVYDEDIYIKKQYEINQTKVGAWCNNIPGALGDYNILKPCIKCNKEDYIPVYAYHHKRSVCQSCFGIYNNELKNKYHTGVILKKGACLIDDEEEN